MSKITDTVWQLAEPIAERAGCSIWDVEYVKEAGDWFLRVYIDKEGGVSIDDCEAVSKELDPILDQVDPIPDSYTFEVSSAGSERALKRPEDFQQFMGSYCAVKLYAPVDGSREHLGYLRGYQDGAVTIEDEGGSSKRFEKKQIAGVRLRVQFHAS